MPTLQEEPLTKVTLNLYASDLATLKSLVGPGYTAKVREIVRAWCRVTKSHQEARKKLWQTHSTS
jgi:hypothetical protein